MSKQQNSSQNQNISIWDFFKWLWYFFVVIFAIMMMTNRLSFLFGVVILVWSLPWLEKWITKFNLNKYYIKIKRWRYIIIIGSFIMGLITFSLLEWNVQEEMIYVNGTRGDIYLTSTDSSQEVEITTNRKGVFLINNEEVEIKDKYIKNINFWEFNTWLILTITSTWGRYIDELKINIIRELSEEDMSIYIQKIEEQKLEEEKRKVEEALLKEEELYQVKIKKLDEINQLIDVSKAGWNYDSVLGISLAVELLLWYNQEIKVYLNDSDDKIRQKANDLKNKLVSVQKNEFPKIRSSYCKLFKDEMWRNDIDVKCNWTTITLVWSIFVRNANIEDSYSIVADMLKKLRFKKANFKRTESSYADYTYYTIESLWDWELE